MHLPATSGRVKPLTGDPAGGFPARVPWFNEPVAGVRIHQANEQASAEVMAERLRADGIPATIVRADAGAPYNGLGQSSSFDILVPEHLSRKARRSLGIVERDEEPDRRGLYALVVLVAVALVVFALALVQRFA